MMRWADHWLEAPAPLARAVATVNPEWAVQGVGLRVEG
jgi:hypothetical protein